IMNLSRSIFAFACTVALPAMGACGSSSGTTTDSDAGRATGVDAGTTAPVDGSADGPKGDGGALGFTPSNLPADFTFDEHEDVVLSGANCGIGAGDAQSGLCVGLFPYSTRFVTQGDGSKIKVFSMKTLTIDTTAHVYVDGPYPVVLVA